MAAVTVLSVDLASRRYAENGIALVRGVPGRVSAECLRPAALGLDGGPDPSAFAAALHRLAEAEGAGVILLDGPQGWRAEHSELVHQRHCERETRTPGKTGLPGVVKPASWTRMAVFSIAVFDALTAFGWPRLARSWSSGRASIESFPTHAWRCFGHTPMPGRANTPSVGPWLEHLTTHGLTHAGPAPTHDEVQAMVAGLAGIALLHGGLAACDVRGVDPFTDGGHWREGLILSPRL